MNPSTSSRRPNRSWSLVSSAVASAAVIVAACGEAGPGPGELAVERITRGDTVVVRTLAGSAWPGPVRLVEELRIGTLEGADEEMFGSIGGVAPDRRGGVYVFDAHAPALRHFDAEGRHTRTLGRKGAGPGEYQDVALGLAVLDDGRVFMRDPRNARINIYDPSGEPAGQWPVASGLFTSRAMVVDTAGHAYLKILTGRPERNKPWPIALLHLDTTGAIVDTVQAPTIEGEPETIGGSLYPRKAWEMSPLGDVVAGFTGSRDGLYAFEVRRRDGSVLRVEKARAPVPVHGDERAELEAVNDWTRRNRGQTLTHEIPPVPHTKPAYRGFYFDEGGRVWVHLHVPAEQGEAGEPRPMPGVEEPIPATSWREPTVFDVFETDGTYLGEVRLPERTSVAAMAGEELWAVQRGELDEPYVVRYRMETGPTSFNPEREMTIERLTPLMYVEAIEPLLPFWVDRLGFTVTTEVPEGDRPGFVILERDGTELMIQTRASVEADVPSLADTPMGGTILFIRVDDLEPFIAAFEGVEVVVPRRRTFYGADEIFVREPAGNIVGFAAFAEEAASDG